MSVVRARYWSSFILEKRGDFSQLQWDKHYENHLNHIRRCESWYAICLEFTMVKLITTTECKCLSAFSLHPPSTPWLVSLLFNILSFSLPGFFAYIVFLMDNGNAASKLTLEICCVLYSKWVGSVPLWRMVYCTAKPAAFLHVLQRERRTGFPAKLVRPGQYPNATFRKDFSLEIKYEINKN